VDAVTIGEQIMIENQESIGEELDYLMRQFKLDHAGEMQGVVKQS